MKTRTTKYLLMMYLLGLGFVCSSCDDPSLIDFRKSNFAWSSSPTAPLSRHVKSWYCNIDSDYYVILEWAGTKMMAAERQRVILCLEETVDGTKTVYRLRYGIVFATTVDSEGKSVITRGRALSDESFEGDRVSGNAIRLAYNGEVFGETKAVYNTELHWLRFDVKAKRENEKVIAIVKDLFPLLAKEESTVEIIRCIAILMGIER